VGPADGKLVCAKIKDLMHAGFVCAPDICEDWAEWRRNQEPGLMG